MNEYKTKLNKAFDFIVEIDKCLTKKDLANHADSDNESNQYLSTDEKIYLNLMFNVKK